MSQNDFSIANADGATVRADINSALQALATLSSGASAPSTTYAGMIWWDTTNSLIKQRNSANTAWITIASFDGSTVIPYRAGTVLGEYATKNPAVLAKTAAYTVVDADDGKLVDCDASGGAFTVTLPAASGRSGFTVGVKKTDSSSNAVTVDGDGADTIDGSATRTINKPYKTEWYRCDGAAWHIEAEARASGTGADFVRKASDETVNNSATLQNDDDLAAGLAANDVMFFRAVLFYDSNATADIKITFTVPTGATIKWGPDAGSRVTSTGSVSGSSIITASGSSLAFGGISSGVMTVSGVVVNGATAGNLQLQWAQNTADASDSKILAGSFLQTWKE